MGSQGEKTFRAVVLAGFGLIACGTRTGLPREDAAPAEDAGPDAPDDVWLLPLERVDAGVDVTPPPSDEAGFPSEAPPNPM